MVMVGSRSPVGYRRASAPQAPLGREVPRPRLIEQLSSRFARPLTVVTAGAGFGKTTMLAQAVRANMAAPLGVDCWITCDATDEDPRRLAAAVVAASSHPAAAPAAATTGTPLDDVVMMMVGLAPVDVCLVFDDVHKLPPASDGHQLIVDILESLPANGHVVLSGRPPLTVPLARFRSATDVIDITEPDLGFTSDEVASLAALHAETRTAPSTRSLGLAGWPALVALSLSTGSPATGRRHTTDFLCEEVVAALDDGSRNALLAMATLGDGSFTEAAIVADGAVGPTEMSRALRSIR